MKKFTAILLTVLMIASLFISCENKITPVSDETVSVSFDESTSRSLTASLEAFDKTQYWWAYAAQKADNTNLKSGETANYGKEGEAQVFIKGSPNAESKGLGSVAGFSQGLWNFKLFAYKGTASAPVLAYQGEIKNVSLKKGSDNKVIVTVSPLASGTGTLKINNTITLQNLDGSAVANNIAKVYTVTALNSTVSIPPTNTSGDEWANLPAGPYKVTVEFKDGSIIYGSGSVVATVYSNLTTEVSGFLKELVTNADFESDINPDVINKEASSNSIDYGALTSTEPTVPTVVTLTEDTNKISASVPASAAAQVIEDVTELATPNDNTSIELALRVDTIQATNATLTLEIGMQATVTEKDTANNVVKQTTKAVSNLTDIVTVTVQLQAGLENVQVFHNNSTTPMNTLTSVDQNAEGIFYNFTDGKLTIKTRSFSPFAITYNVPKFVAKVGDVKYTTLEDAVSAVPTDNTQTTIKLLGNASGNGIVVHAGQNIIFDLNGCEYCVDGETVGSTGTETQAFQLLGGSTVEFRNGTLSCNAFKSYILIQNYSDLKLDNVTLDGSKLYGYSSIYTLSCNFGNTTITGNTNIIPKNGHYALDVYYWPSGSYGEGVSVTFDENYTGTVTGKISYGSDGTTTGINNVDEKAKLIIKNGNFDSTLTTYNLNTDGKTGIEIYGGNIDGKFFGLAGGYGTVEDPYVINTAEQFTQLYKLSPVMATDSDKYLYFSVESDLDFTNSNYSPCLPLLRGEIDFNNHTVSGITYDILNMMTATQAEYLGKYPSDDEAYSLVQMIASGKISNLILNITDDISLSSWGNWVNNYIADSRKIVFENITITSNDITIENTNATNFSPFISQVFNSTLEMKNCVADVNYRGGKYGAAFLGGYGKNSKIIIENCKNSGNISAERASVISGNHSNSNTNDYIVKNCINTGIITGTISNGFYCAWETADMFKPKSIEKERNELGEIKLLSTIKDVVVENTENGSLIIRSDNANYNHFKISGSIYARMYDSNGNNAGTDLVGVKTTDSLQKNIDTSFKKLHIIDIKGLTEDQINSITEDSYGNKIVSVNSVEYYVHDSRISDSAALTSVVGTPSNNYIGELSYTLYCYDSDGNILGSMNF